MRAFLGCLLVLGLAVSPAIAGTSGSETAATAESSTSSSTSGNSSGAAQPEAAAAPAANTAAKPAASSMESELGELRDEMDSQAKQIQEQNDQLKAQQEKVKALEEQIKAANSGAEKLTPSPVTAGSSSGVTLASAAGSSSSVPAASTARPVPAAQLKGGASDTTNSPLSFHIGGADFTPGGFVDAMDVFRSTDNGGSLGTSFGGVLYNTAGNYPAAGSTENRFSLQNSRISLRVDSNIAGGKAVGYLETDFLGNAATSIFVTSNSDTLRLRLYFLDYTKGKFEFLGGQDWSMLTSNRNGIGFMPADIFFTNDVDTNYQLGLVWQRTAQVRFLYHASKTVVAGISLENPEQYIGSTGVVTLPTLNAANPNFNNQFDNNGSATGGNANTPNLVPDIIAKIAYDPTLGGKHEHIEVAGIERTFRAVTFVPAAAGAPQTSVSNKAVGAGIAVNSNWEIFKNFHIIENAFWSDGDGRDIIGLIPDFVVRPLNTATTPSYTLSPIHSGSFIAGFEYQRKNTQVFGYTSGVYASKNFVIAGAGPSCVSAGSTCPGYGQPLTSAGTAEGDNRYMQEHTLGLIQTFFRSPQYGAVQLMLQASYVGRQPWFVPTGTPANAHLGMAYVDFRYTLP